MAVILHIGFGKTGTTAIQDYCFTQRERLRKCGLIYPEIGLRGTGHRALAEKGVAEFSDYLSSQYKAIKRLQEANSGADVLISSEHFSFVKAEYVASVSNALKGLDIRVVFYVRPQVGLVESAFLQWIKVNGGRSMTVERFFNAHRHSFDFLEKIEPWRRFLGDEKIIARVYDKAVIGEDVCVDFFQLIGSQCEVDPDATMKSNTSLSVEFVNLVTAFDEMRPTQERRQQFISELMRLSNLFGSRPKKTLVGAQLACDIADYYAHSNSEFADVFLDSFQKNILCGAAS